MNSFKALTPIDTLQVTHPVLELIVVVVTILKQLEYTFSKTRKYSTLRNSVPESIPHTGYTSEQTRRAPSRCNSRPRSLTSLLLPQSHRQIRSAQCVVRTMCASRRSCDSRRRAKVMFHTHSCALYALIGRAQLHSFASEKVMCTKMPLPGAGLSS